MATLTLTIVSGASVQRTLTFSATDAQRILAAFQKIQNNPTANTQDIADFLAAAIGKQLIGLVQRSEYVPPAAPAFS